MLRGKLNRTLIIVVGAVAFLASVVTITNVVCPDCLPVVRFQPEYPDVSGAWVGTVHYLFVSQPQDAAIPTGPITVLVDYENRDTGAILGRVQFGKPLSSDNNGTFDIDKSAVNKGNHLSFTMFTYIGSGYATYIGSYDNNKKTLSGTFYTNRGLNGEWTVARASSSTLQSATSLASASARARSGSMIGAGPSSLLLLLCAYLLVRDDRRRDERGAHHLLTLS